MSNNINFKSLWKQEQSSRPEIASLLSKGKTYKKKKAWSLIFINLTLLITVVAISLIWFYYQPQFVTTKIGVLLVIISMLLFVAVYNNSLFTVINKKEEVTVSEFLKQLLQIQKKQLFIQKSMMNVYFILLFVGICLSLYEFASKLNTVFLVVFYGVFFLWIAINWFYFRPKIINKQQASIKDLIERFQLMNDQLTQ